MLLFNFLLTLICIWILLAVNYRYIQPTRWNKHRFKLFALRDRLAILAMQGKIDERSIKYIYLMKTINTAISETGQFKLSRFMNFLVWLQETKKAQDMVDMITSEITEKNDELKMIFSECILIIDSIFKAKATLAFRLIMATKFVVTTLNRFFGILSNSRILIASKAKRWTGMKNELENIKQQVTV